MGVPAFFRWLCKKYPSIVINAHEEKQKVDPTTDKKLPIDSSQQNPNGVEFDNLYLDMNGIIHPCTHPEDRPAPKNEDEMMIIIFEFIDRIFSIVRPRKLLYMAIDGVAPRAKMNQQRSRRFRAAKETTEKCLEIKRLREQIVANGGVVPPETPNSERFDSNCITPGTPFMHKLAECLRYYINDRLNNDPGWKNIQVILSDANCPGEGEHKIMDFIRRQRANPDHNPNTHHVLCGADADLIMLGLATHEPYFTIIREEFRADRPRPCEICSQFGHETKECTGSAREKHGQYDELNQFVPTELRYIFLRLSILREYLQRDLFIPNLPFKFDIERTIDDWVFMCFFVGNDFLPHLPSLEIREGAIDRLVNLYKTYLPQIGGYLTNNGIVNLHLAQTILTGIGKVEDEIFKKRQANELEFRRRNKEKKKRMKFNAYNDDNAPMQMPNWMKTGPYAPTPLMNIKKTTEEKQAILTSEFDDLLGKVDKPKSESPVDDDKKGIKRKHEIFQDDVPVPVKTERKKDGDDEADEEDNDPVRLWEDGWRQRYYKVKFDVGESDVEFRYKVAEEYAIGLCWVLRYYYQGVPSWNWYYPYHYAPFASDFVHISEVKEKFDDSITEPFKPFEQLMAVFPAASCKHIPQAFRTLMCDPQSEIIDFYPDDFQIDLNGKKQAWQGVALLPFVDENRLKKALVPYYHLLGAEESKRNVRGEDCLFIGKTNLLFDFFKEIYTQEVVVVEDQEESKERILISTSLSGGIAGKIWYDENYVYNSGTFKSPLPYLCPDLKNNKAISVKYKDPQYEKTYIFKSVILPGAIMPENTLKGDEHRGGGYYKPNLGFNNDVSYRQNKDASAANRMLANSMSTDGNVVSSAYGGHSSVYGSYRTNSGNNNNNYQRQNSYNNDNQQQNSYNNQRYNNQQGGSGRPQYNNNNNYNYNNRQNNNPRFQNNGQFNNNNNRNRGGQNNNNNYNQQQYQSYPLPPNQRKTFE